MASPMVDGRVEPHRKATYTLDVSDQIRREERAGSSFSSVKCMQTPVCVRIFAYISLSTGKQLTDGPLRQPQAQP